MVEVKPFNGITYNPIKFNKIDDLTSPPYDIISKKIQNELYNKNKYNFVRLILGKKYNSDNEIDNCYTRSKEFLDKWLSDKILIKSEKKMIFPYKIYYEINNKKKNMNGFFILLKIDKNYKKIRAHEKTLSKPKEDRLNLMKSTKANLEPIQLLYIDEKNEINKIINKKIKNPLFETKGYDKFIHKLWKLDDEKIINLIENTLKNKILFIADGHHRYQTSINYANEMKQFYKNDNKNLSYNYLMVVLVNMFDEGLTILPTHRLIKKNNFNINDFLNKLKKYFDISKFDINYNENQNVADKIIKNISNLNKKQFALYLKNKYYVLTLKNLNDMNKFKDGHSKIWRSLDVSILQKLILEEILDINQKNIEEHVFYTRDIEEAINLVEEDKYNFSFILNPTKIDELKLIAENGEHMPQKSTYFLPKMLSGLVLNKFDI